MFRLISARILLLLLCFILVLSSSALAEGEGVSSSDQMEGKALEKDTVTDGDLPTDGVEEDTVVDGVVEGMMDYGDTETISKEKAEAERKILDPHNTSDSDLPSDARIPDQPASIDDEMILKQIEVEHCLFEDHVENIRLKGIVITHTSAKDQYVEIGINPFNQENADFIYEILGTEMVEVVNGEQAEVYDTSAVVDQDVEIDSAAVLAADGNETHSNRNSYILPLITAAAFAILGGAVFFRYRLKRKVQ